jgi:Radical SAM superfamily/4Fe-4S single cluster domain
MRSPAEMVTIQIELTSSCVLHCSNCTRFSGVRPKETFMSIEELKRAVDSLVEYSKLPHACVGAMGGEPLLHPDFVEFCDYAVSKIDRMKLGLWSTFPSGAKYKGYREVIARTFGNILLNDHSRDDILHAPVLMAAEDYFKNADGTTDDRALFAAVEHCWIQESWSASVNSKGAFFCEVAAALDDLFGGPGGWPVEEGWWKRVPKDFTSQMEWACRKCGAALPIERTHNSQDPRDDVSLSNLERLKAIKSRKVARGEFILHEEAKVDPALIGHTYPRQTYQDAQYRQNIAAKYDMYLVLNERGYWEPRLKEDGGYHPPAPPSAQPPSLFKIFQDSYR